MGKLPILPQRIAVDQYSCELQCFLLRTCLFTPVIADSGLDPFIDMLKDKVKSRSLTYGLNNKRMGCLTKISTTITII
jgi:hypothetical protein